MDAGHFLRLGNAQILAQNLGSIEGTRGYWLKSVEWGFHLGSLPLSCPGQTHIAKATSCPNTWSWVWFSSSWEDLSLLYSHGKKAVESLQPFTVLNRGITRVPGAPLKTFQMLRCKLGFPADIWRHMYQKCLDSTGMTWISQVPFRTSSWHLFIVE